MRLNQLHFIRIGTGSRPPRPTTLALELTDSPTWCLPALAESDFERVCNALQLESREQQMELADLLKLEPQEAGAIKA